jgi:hypothetical protein
MNAYLIDPFNKSITAVNYDGKLQSMYALLGDDVSCVDVCRINHAGDAIFVDDEGLLKDEDNQAYFYVTHESGSLETHVMLAGRGLVLGCDGNGDSCSPEVQLDQLTRRIIWAHPSEGKREAIQLVMESGQVVSFESLDDFLRALTKGGRA